MPKSENAAANKATTQQPPPARRDFEALKKRRLRAATMFARGKSRADVAKALGVSPQAVSQWYRLWQVGGREALCGAGRAGRLPRLSDAQLEEVLVALRKGPRANGFPTEMWTLARVGEVITAVTGVQLGQTQTWDTLRRRLGWSRQRPARRARERNDEAIAAWVEKDWPRIKKAHGAAAPGSCSKTSPGSASSPR